MGYEKMKGWAFERKRRRVAKLGRAWTTDDERLVRHTLRYAHPDFALISFAFAVQYVVYGHVGRVEARRVMYDLPVPGHPLAHTGTCVPYFARLDCPC
jgi:hypothetical protein